MFKRSLYLALAIFMAMFMAQGVKAAEVTAEITSSDGSVSSQIVSIETTPVANTISTPVASDDSTSTEGDANSEITTLVDTATTEENAIVNAEADTVAEPLEGMTVETPASIPGAWGLLWKNIKENIILAATFDPVKKAERQLQFAEEKTRLAEKISESSADPKVQERAQKMIENANRLMARVQEKKDMLLANSDDRKTRLLNNIAKHEANATKILDKMEDKIPVAKLEQFQALRTKMEERGAKFMENLENNPNIPEEVKAQIAERKQLIEQRQEERLQIREENKELLEKAKAGDESAKQELQANREERVKEMETKREEVKMQKTELINQIKTGDEAVKQQAVQELKKLNLQGQVIKNQVEKEVQVIKNQVQNKVQNQAVQKQIQKVQSLRAEVKPVVPKASSGQDSPQL